MEPCNVGGDADAGVLPSDFGEASYICREWGLLRSAREQEQFLRELGVNFDGFRVLDEWPGRYLSRYSEAVRLLFDHFVFGLRLPLDPFVCEFLNECRAFPVDISPVLMACLVGFATVARFFGVHASAGLFALFFKVEVDRARGRLTCSPASGAIRLFGELPAEAAGWSQREVFVESRGGWGYDPARRDIVALSAPLVDSRLRVFGDFSEALEKYLGVVRDRDCRIVAQRFVFDWKQCVHGVFPYMAGQGCMVLPGDSFCLQVLPVAPARGWRVHVGGVLPSLCPECWMSLSTGERVYSASSVCECVSRSSVVNAGLSSEYGRGLKMLKGLLLKPPRVENVISPFVARRARRKVISGEDAGGS